MITGHRPAIRRQLVLLCVAASACSTSVAAANWSLEQLMQTLGAVKASHARFVERKHMTILSAPLELSGALVYVAPDRLEKHMLTPRQESLLLEGNQLTIENKERSQRRTVALQDYPVIWAFVESIRSTMAGDLATLKRFYQVGLDGTEHRWRLTLKPTDPRIQEVVSEIRISGSGSWINIIEIIEPGGDRSVMTITRDGP
jgi:hypothetical protein